MEFQKGYQGFKNIFWFCTSLKLTYQFLILQLFNNNNIEKKVRFKTFHWNSNHEYKQPTFTMTSLKTENDVHKRYVVKWIICEITLKQDKTQFIVDEKYLE